MDAEGTESATPSRRLTAGLRAIAGLTLDVTLPPLCPTCREPVADAGGLCAACWGSLSFIARP